MFSSPVNLLLQKKYPPVLSTKADLADDKKRDFPLSLETTEYNVFFGYARKQSCNFATGSDPCGLDPFRRRATGTPDSPSPTHACARPSQNNLARSGD